MLREIAILVFLIGSLMGSMFLWFVYRRQYRFASQLTDMLPYYPSLVILCSLSSIGISFVLALSRSYVFLFLIPPLVINFIVQFFLFWQWFSSYRIAKLRNFFRILKDSPKIQIISIGEWLSTPMKNPDKILVIIRHDVDISLKRALQMMREEQKFDIPACYYIRHNAGPYSFEEAQSAIQQLTTSPLFEVGFHYESVTKSDGDLEMATQLFTKEVEEFRRIYPLRMICSHGTNKYNDALIRKLIDFSKLGLISAYTPPFDYYAKDPGGRHHFPMKNNQTFLQTLETIYSLPAGTLVHINIHPDWWF